MQAKLHRWAAADPGRRFDDLYNFVHDPATLRVAYDRVAGNRGANTPGVDGKTVAYVEERVGFREFLADLRVQLKAGAFTPLLVRERKIPKPGGSGKLRRLGIPALADKVVQAALKLVLEPVFEADFEPVSYGFRPGRRAHDAIAEIHKFGTHGYRWVLDADVEAALDPWSYCSFADFAGSEESVLRGGDLDTQAFSAPGVGEDGAQLAALDLLQYGLAGDAEGLGGVAERDPAVGRVAGEDAAQLVGEADAPRRAGGDLLTGDEAVVEPAQQGGRGDAELAGGLGHVEQVSFGGGVAAGLVAGDVPVGAQRGDSIGGERQSAGGGAVLPVEDPGDLGVGVVHGQAADQADGVL